MRDIIITYALMGACMGALIIWDIYVAWYNDIPNDQDTESGILRKMGSRWAGIPFSWGALGWPLLGAVYAATD